MIDLHLDIDIKTLSEKDAKQKIDDINKVAMQFYKIGNYEEGTFCAENSLEMAEVIDYPKGIADARYIFALIYISNYDYEKAIPEMIDIAKIYNSLSEFKMEAVVYKQLGIAYWRVNDYKNQIDTFFKALYIFRDLKEETHEADILNSIANYYMIVWENPLALEYYRMALNMAGKYNYVSTCIMILYNMACVYSNIQEKEKALKYFNTALEFNTKIEKNPFYEVRIKNNMGSVYSGMGEHEKAEEIFLKTIDYFIKTKNDADRCDALVNLGGNYRRMKEYNKAEKTLKEVLELSTRINSRSMMSTSFKELTEYYTEVKEFKNALFNYKEYAVITNEIYKSIQEEDIRKLNVLHQVDINKKEADVLSEKNEVLKSMNNELIKLNEDKNNYMDVAANDLKIPLEKISQSIYELKELSLGQDKKIKNLNTILNYSSNMQQIISGLLTANEKETRMAYD